MTRQTVRRLCLAASVLALLSCSSTPEPAVAQQITNISVKKVENTQPGPKLTAFANGVRSKATERDLGLRSLEISVDVRGDIAETVVTASFENPTSELLEGQFQLNMARGAVVTGYSLDINGTLIDGVLETKYKAAEAYQRRVTQRIDPGLAEVDYSDKFEARIYPIPARGARTIRLKMVSQFDPNEGYVLPLSIAGEVKRFKLSIDGEAKIVALPKGISGANVIEAENVKLQGPLQLGPADRASPMLVSQHPGAERFFDITAPAPRAAPEQRHPLHIFWDRSVSRADDELKQEAQLAEDFALKRGLRRVTVTLFDSGKSETIEVDADRLTEKLDDVRYRGGTSYATIAATKVASDADCLMFSDGRVSIDDRTNFRLPCSITAITSGPESDNAWLGDLAERTGGAMLTLTKKNATETLNRMLKPDAGILSVTDGAGHPVEAVRLPADPRNFHIVGPLPDDGVILVRLAGEASPRRFTQTSSRTPTFSGPGALWARQRLGVEATEKKPDDLAAMARRYNVATPQASFVVLETPNDYVQSKIEPPSSYPKELQLTYASLRKSADAAESRAKEGRMTQVVMMWNEQKKWWATKFDGKISEAEKKRAAAEGGNRDSDDRPRPTMAAPPPPPPPPPAAMARPEASGSDRVVVTGQIRQSTAQGVPVAVDAISREAPGAPADEAEADSGRAGSISVADWNADRPYLDRLDKAGANWESQIDKEMKTPEGVLPLFWFDVAEWHWRAGRKDEARRAAEAALDMPARDNQTLAIVAARLSRYGSHDRAVWLLERLMEREPDRPQPMRTLGMALIERAKFSNSTDSAKADLGRAIDLLSKAATGVYEQPARGVEVVTLMEANAALAKLKRMGGSSSALDERLVALLDADVRVVMEWNTPRTDLDLWVTEPKGAKVGYSSPLSPWGGKLSGDVTTGYGPEEYVIRTANNGTYHVRAKTFASDRANPNGPSSLTVRLIRNFGRPSQSEELIDLEMAAEDRGEVEVGKFTIE